jgi:hypothetical protein
VGSPLVAPQEGYGLRRQTPEFRRLMMLTQAALDPADPINFARHYMLAPIPPVTGDVRLAGSPPVGGNLGPRALLTSATVGDSFVPIATAYAFARAAGALPFPPPSAATRIPEYADFVTPQPLFDALGGKTPDRILVESGAMEGIARLARAPAGPDCAANRSVQPACRAPRPSAECAVRRCSIPIGSPRGATSTTSSTCPCRCGSRGPPRSAAPIPLPSSEAGRRVSSAFRSRTTTSPTMGAGPS